MEALSSVSAVDLAALARLGRFVGPWIFIAATGAVLLVMWRRQFASDARAAVLIEDGR